MPEVKIVVRSSGPLRVYGPFELEDPDGKTFTLPDGQWVSLCRCGASNNKPYCDTSHRECAFEADTKAT
ncbi:MAG: CDGSH iron-sulfur domain-containing protein [Chloroflexi bacterium]|nr:CDGSH iron-sulfur domain-containing protein [Chloroflexota bacterium]MCH8224830.1 CDGSH iron-sulfur domain-containing protein [Chloroflexota bacterium]MCI0845737.1 CDGSH iron-sulfur domain-containing protein [Chloroflexota bacterium]